VPQTQQLDAGGYRGGRGRRRHVQQGVGHGLGGRGAQRHRRIRRPRRIDPFQRCKVEGASVQKWAWSGSAPPTCVLASNNSDTKVGREGEQDRALKDGVDGGQPLLQAAQRFLNRRA